MPRSKQPASTAHFAHLETIILNFQTVGHLTRPYILIYCHVFIYLTVLYTCMVIILY